MKKYILALLCLASLAASSQEITYVRPSARKTSFYAGFHAIDDDDVPFRNLVDPQTLNWAPYPAKIGVLYDIADPIVLEFSASYLKLRNNPGNKYLAPYNCWGFDLNAQNHFYFYKKSEYHRYGISADRKRKTGSLYVLLGISANIKSQLNEDYHTNMNLGGGGNWWITANRWAINAQVSAQIGLAGSMFSGNANQLRYSLGVVYKI